MDGQTLIARAREVAPALRQRADAASEARCIPEETIADFKAAGFFRVMQPEKFGGYALSPQVLYDLQVEIGAACPSSAWVLGVVAVHSWQLALFDPRAQEEVWGEDTEVLISSSYMPVGKVTPAEGGFQLSGRWGYSSGCDHCDWAFLGAFVPNEGGPPDMRTFLVPKGDYTIDDTWYVSGLKATGSKDVVVEDVFVPEYRTHKFSDGYKCHNPGNTIHRADLYRLPFGQVFVRSVSTTILGICQGMLDAYATTIRERISRASGEKAIEDPHAQRLCAEAETTIDESRLVIARNFEEMFACIDAGERIPIERRVKFRYESARCVARCLAVVDEMFTAAAGSAIRLESPMNRFFKMRTPRGPITPITQPARPRTTVGCNWA